MKPVPTYNHKNGNDIHIYSSIQNFQHPWFDGYKMVIKKYLLKNPQKYFFKFERKSDH